MQFWDNVVHTAMIGTDKKTTGANDLPPGLAEAAGIILANDMTDKEEKFLQIASLAFNYRQCGVVALHKEQVTLQPAPAEEKTYCNNNAIQALKDILSEESIPLLLLWLQYCHAKNNIVHPEIVPTLLSAGVQQKKLQPLITSCCGKRGEWLSHFNEAWHFSSNQTREEQWQTGTPEQRKSALREMRESNPLQAREWLQQTWPQEDAGSKLSLLEAISDTLNQDDIPFLESLQSEKGKKVKEMAVTLLKQIPGSSVVLQYQQLLQQSVSLKKEKALLGLSTRLSLQFHLPGHIDESIFKSGIDKLSNTKELTDEQYIISQLMRFVPPSSWETLLNSQPADIIGYLQKDEVGKKMIPSLVIAITNFKDHRWAIAFMQYSEIFYLDIIPLIPLQQQEYYSNRFFDKHPDSIIRHATERKDEWGTELAMKIFKHTAKNPYQYPRAFYNQHIHLIPGSIVPELEKITPAEEYIRTMWDNTRDYILKLLRLKAQVIQSFS